MATVDKNFKVKHGLIVEGTTATVNGANVLTTNSSINTDFVSETNTNKYFTDQRAIDAINNAESLDLNGVLNVTGYSSISGGVDNFGILVQANAGDIGLNPLEGNVTINGSIVATQSYVDNAITNSVLTIDTTGPLSYNNGILDLVTGDTLYVGTVDGALHVDTGKVAQTIAGGGLVYNGDFGTLGIEMSTLVNNLAGNGLHTDVQNSIQLAVDTRDIVDNEGGLLATGNGWGLSVDTSRIASVSYVDALTTDDIEQSPTASNRYYADYLVDQHLSGGDGIYYGNGLITAATAGDFGTTVTNGIIAIDRTFVDNWYDAAGTANTLAQQAEQNAIAFTTAQLMEYTKTTDIDSTVGGYGYLKSADLSGYATQTYVDNAVAGLVDGAPELLNTLNELAAAIGDDENYATTVANLVAGKQDALVVGPGLEIGGTTGTLISTKVDGLTIIDNYGSLEDTLAVPLGYGLTVGSLGVAVDTATIATLNDVANLGETKQDILSAGSAISISNNQVSVGYSEGLSLNNFGKLQVATGAGLKIDGDGTVKVNTGWGLATGLAGLTLDTSIYGSGLSVGPTGIYVNTSTIASVDYVANNYVNVADLPGQLNDYVLANSVAQADGVASLDGDGQVPLSQLGNVPDAYITSTDGNFYVSGAGELSLTNNVTVGSIYYGTAMDSAQYSQKATLTSGANQIASISSSFEAAEIIVAVSTASGKQISKFLMITDASHNVYITEYGIVDAGSSIATIDVEWLSGASVYAINATVSEAGTATVFVTGLNL